MSRLAVIAALAAFVLAATCSGCYGGSLNNAQRAPAPEVGMTVGLFIFLIGAFQILRYILAQLERIERNSERR